MKNCESNIDSLFEEFVSKRIPYAILLKTEEWKNHRNKIVARDEECCTNCGLGATVKSMVKSKNGLSRYFNVFKVVDSQGKVGKKVSLVEKPRHLEVHHRYYVMAKNPWEYPDEALITLCNWCHQKIHDTTNIPCYSHEGEKLNYTPCHRCAGSGTFPEHNHVYAGVCFHCDGARYEELIDQGEN